MHCLECTTTDTRREAAAVCSACGAAACPTHTHELRTEVWSQSIGNPTVRVVRRLHCSECARLEAHRAPTPSPTIG